MDVDQIIKVAEANKGNGWLGAMELMDFIDTKVPLEQAIQIKLNMQQEVGRLILSGTIGCDESAMRQACNQCIEVVIENLIERADEPT